MGTTYLPASGAAACEVCAYGTSSGVVGRHVAPRLLLGPVRGGVLLLAVGPR